MLLPVPGSQLPLFRIGVGPGQHDEGDHLDAVKYVAQGRQT